MTIKKPLIKTQLNLISTGIFSLLLMAYLTPISASAHDTSLNNCKIYLNLDHGPFQYGWGGKEVGGACKRNDGSWNWWTYVNRCSKNVHNDNGTLKCY